MTTLSRVSSHVGLIESIFSVEKREKGHYYPSLMDGVPPYFKEKRIYEVPWFLGALRSVGIGFCDQLMSQCPVHGSPRCLHVAH